MLDLTELTDDQLRESRVAWFCVLERARDIGDAELASQAGRELHRLGVTVRYRRVRAGDRR